jgi:hypothetical protein
LFEIWFSLFTDYPNQDVNFIVTHKEAFFIIDYTQPINFELLYEFFKDGWEDATSKFIKQMKNPPLNRKELIPVEEKQIKEDLLNVICRFYSI